MADKKTFRHPFDPELQSLLNARPYLSASILPENIASLRKAIARTRLTDSALSCLGRITFSELMIPLENTSVELPLIVLRPAQSAGMPRGICFLHGGGMISGDNRTGLEVLLEWVTDLGVAVASVGYRLAPEHPHPIPVEDCYAALAWLSRNRAALGFEEEPLILVGTSAGAGLAAGVALLARERGGPAISCQFMMSPMLDDMGRFPSSSAFDGEGTWDQRSNRTAWEALLGDSKGGTDVPSCAAPSRAQDLSGLPPAYLDVGSIETFRDEVIDYGTRLAQAGVATDLHMWSGAFHGFDWFAAETAVARAARATRIAYLRRLLGIRGRP